MIKQHQHPTFPSDKVYHSLLEHLFWLDSIFYTYIHTRLSLLCWLYLSTGQSLFPIYQTNHVCSGVGLVLMTASTGFRTDLWFNISAVESFRKACLEAHHKSYSEQLEKAEEDRSADIWTAILLHTKATSHWKGTTVSEQSSTNTIRMSLFEFTWWSGTNSLHQKCSKPQSSKP